MNCKKCGAASAFARVTGECLECKPYNVIQGDRDYRPVIPVPGQIGGPTTKTDNQPTLRDMWAMAIFAKYDTLWLEALGTRAAIKESYKIADNSMLIRNNK